jgi:hypothetical protein
MTTRLEIILDINNVRYYLDTNGIDTIPLTFNIANIKDISTTKGSFSKSIVIPETRKNRDVFNNISDLNAQSDFNPNKRSRAYILVDSEMIIEGYFQLTDVSLDINTDKGTLTLVIFTDNNDFYTLLAEEYIEDLDLSRFDHIWNAENVAESWTQSYESGYYYPLIDYGWDWTISTINGSQHLPAAPKSGLIDVAQMFPSVYVRVIWDQIFSDVNFSWTSNSLTTETPFDDLIIPFNGKGPGVNTDLFTTSLFRVGMTASQAIKTTAPYIFSAPYPGYVQTPPSPTFSGWTQPQTWTQTYNSASITNFTITSGQLPTTKRIGFSNESPPNQDPNNIWNSTLFQYENTSGYPITQRFGFDLNIRQLFYYSANNRPTLQLYRSRNPNTGATVSGGYAINTCETWPTTSYYPVDYTNQSGWTKTTSAAHFGLYEDYEAVNARFYSQAFQVYDGESVWLEYTYHQSGFGQYDVVVGAPPIYVLKVNPGLTVSQIDISSYIFNEVSDLASPGMPISMTSCIPKKIKKRDFILSIVKMFNLVVEPNRDFPNTLNIETRDYYYKTGKIKDWSKKLDLNDNVDIQILGESQNKRTKFKYKNDSDFFNSDYTEKTGLSFGEYQYITENEFSDGEKIMEIIFSPTPGVGIGVFNNVVGATQSSMVIPKIGKLQSGAFQYSASGAKEGSSNIRILQRKYLSLPTGDAWILDTIGNTQSSYPYSGHVDNPYNPTFDINFGQTEGLYYPQTTTTNNNLFTRYWQKMMDEVSDRDSRIITCSVYLTPFDIINFRFNDNIYIDFGSGGQYYKVNKIENYDPTKITTCKVELIKTKEIAVPRATVINTAVVVGDNTATPYITPTYFYSRTNNVFNPNVQVFGNNNSIVRSSVILGNANNVVGSLNNITGDSNNVASSRSFVVGDSNNILTGSDRNFIIGSTNSVSQGVSSVKILGSRNTISTPIGSNPIENVIVIGDDMTSNTSNTVNIAGILVVNNNLISAGKDEILNMFSENSIINVIDAGRDKVRNFSSSNTIFLISAGRDNVI